ncbi:MAG: DUF3592 domain-containing protein [Luteolibacter sp.]
MMKREKMQSFVGGGCLALFGLPFLGAGLFMTWLYFSGYEKWWAARSWLETPCWIESAELKQNGDEDSRKAVVTYRYEFEGRSYQGDRVSLHGGSDNIGDFHVEAHRELSHHAGGTSSGAEGEARQPFRCHVNPENPAESVIYRTLRWELQAFMAIFALTFPAVGGGLVFAAVWGTRAMRKEAALSEKYPGEPWKWKTHWAGTTISECPKNGRWPLILYTLWSALIIFPLIVATALSGAFQTDRSAWWVLVYLALWCIPAWFTSKRIRHRLAVGEGRLELQDTPACPGGVLRGSFLLAKPLPTRAVPELHLFCEKQIIRGTGEDKSTIREKIWSARETVSQDRITRDFTGFRLPVSIAIPPDGPESSILGDDSEKHVWNLELKVPGTPIHSVFEIPVFRDGKSPVLMPRAVAPSIAETVSRDLPALLAEQRIEADFDHGGMPLSIIRPAAHKRSLIGVLIIFNLIWTAAAFMLVTHDAPVVIKIIWPLTAAAIWLTIFWQIFYRRAVTFTREGVTVRHQLGPFNREQTIQKSQITGISYDSNMSSNSVKFYRVRLETGPSKGFTVADGIRGSAPAEALAGRLKTWQKSG